MPYYADLREYLDALESAGKLIRINRPINKDTELSPLVRLQYRGLPEEKRRAFLFENPTGSDGQAYASPVAIGALAGSPDIYALGLKCTIQEIGAKLAGGERNPIPPRLVSNGPVQEEVHTGDKVMEHSGLGEFPIPIATPGFDCAPYITAPYWVTRDPESGVSNVGMYRAMVKSPLRTGLNFSGPNKGAAVHLRKHKALNTPMPAAIVIGGPPNLGYVAVSPLPKDIDEFAVAGGIAGEPVELVKCITCDLAEPARAEIILEGEVDPNVLEPEAPFGESYGFVGPMDMNPVFNIKCITHRRNPIWLATISQYPPSESTKMRQFGFQATMYHHLRHNLGMAHVLDLAYFEEVSSGRMLALKLDETTPDEVRRTMEAAAKRAPYVKIMIAVDRDVNVHDLGAVMLAVGMRTQPHRDYRIESYPAPSLSDYSLEPLDILGTREPGAPDCPTASRILIDTTMKWPFPPVSLPRKAFMDRAQQLWIDLGLGELKLNEPWFGVDLGYWNAEHEAHAQAAVKGDYYLAGRDYEKQRRRRGQ